MIVPHAVEFVMNRRWTIECIECIECIEYRRAEHRNLFYDSTVEFGWFKSTKDKLLSKSECRFSVDLF